MGGLGDKTAKMSLRLKPDERNLLENAFEFFKAKGYQEQEKFGIGWRASDSLGAFTVACAVKHAKTVMPKETTPKKKRKG